MNINKYDTPAMEVIELSAESLCATSADGEDAIWESYPAAFDEGEFLN